MKTKDGAKIIILSPDKILLFHRDNIPTISSPDCWCMVGGGIEDGETPEEGLIREVKEEVSYDLKEFELILKTKGLQGEDLWLYVAFVDKDEEQKFIHGSGEGQGIGWFTIDEALALKLSSGTRIRLTQYRELLEEMIKTKRLRTTDL